MQQKEAVVNKRALRAVKEGRIFQIICNNFSFYVFVSNNRSYVLSTNTCSCPAFIFRVLRGEKPWCYHIDSLKLALELDRVKRFTLSKDECRDLLLDVLSQGKSLILEKLWTSRERR